MRRANVDLHTISVWLGHASIDTTAIYAQIDLETKARAVAAFDADEPHLLSAIATTKGLMAFLRSYDRPRYVL